ncbi:MAG: formate/nitrite transporter family protein [Gemmatimonadales bacterium]
MSQHASLRADAVSADAKDRPLVEPQKSYHTVLEQQIIVAEEELKRSSLSLFLSGLTGGLDVGLGPFAMAVFLTLMRGTMPAPLLRLSAANLYSLGFIFVVIGRSALFTEHTTSAIQPVFDGRTSTRALLRLWGIVLAANLVGAAVVAWFAVRLGSSLHVADAIAFGQLADRMTSPPWHTIFFSGVGAGWLMGLLSWLSVAARETISQIVVVWLTTFVIGLAGLHHCIAGSAEVLAGIFSGGTSWLDFARFLVFAVLGNVFGGTVMVSSLKFAHVRRAG